MNNAPIIVSLLAICLPLLGCSTAAERRAKPVSATILNLDQFDSAIKRLQEALLREASPRPEKIIITLSEHRPNASVYFEYPVSVAFADIERKLSAGLQRAEKIQISDTMTAWRDIANNRIIAVLKPEDRVGVNVQPILRNVPKHTPLEEMLERIPDRFKDEQSMEDQIDK